MSVLHSNPTRPRRVRFVWLIDAKRDLLFYIGAALAGWLYVALIWYANRTLAHPLTDALATFQVAGAKVALTLELLVVVSWAFLLDAPHIWATLGRTVFDPEEWRTRGRELLASFAWFVVGPAAVLLPYATGAALSQIGIIFPVSSLALGAGAFFVFVRFWAYYHVVRQHWGFFSLYKRKLQDNAHERLDRWSFNVALYLPLLLFLTGPAYPHTPGMPNLGLQAPLFGTASIAALAYPSAAAILAGTLVVYAGVQVWTWASGGLVNASKLLYLLLLVPLHLVAFSTPLMAIFAVPLVTVGHNLQYHCLVYTYGRRKYGGSCAPGQQLARLLFRNAGVYAAAGLAFTFLFFRGPWIDWLGHSSGMHLDRLLFNSLGMMAGIREPASLGLGEQVFAALLIGFALQHYYLDAKIWRVSRDKEVQEILRVSLPEP